MEHFAMFDGVLNTPSQDQPPQILWNCSEMKSSGIFPFFAFALVAWDVTDVSRHHLRCSTPFV